MNTYHVTGKIKSGWVCTCPDCNDIHTRYTTVNHFVNAHTAEEASTIALRSASRHLTQGSTWDGEGPRAILVVTPGEG